MVDVLQTLEVSQSTYKRWRNQYGRMKSEEAKRLKQLEYENKQLKRLVADQALDNQMLKFINEGNWQALLANAMRFKLRAVSLKGSQRGPVRRSINLAECSVTWPSRATTKP